MAEATKEVVATYPDAEAARTAIQTLERTGIDAESIRMIGTRGVDTPKVDAAMREPDMAVTRTVGTRGFTMAVLVAVGVAAVAAAVTWLVSGSTSATLIAAAGGFMFGGPMGFFYGGASALAVSEQWGDTFEAAGPATIAVHVVEERVIDLRERIERTHPLRVTVS
jgi:hypothetical protein